MPVDTKTFSDYLNTVKVPMDFGTIKARIEAGHYANPHQWLEDMKLVFLNARTYNAPGSDVNVMATTLQVTRRHIVLRATFHGACCLIMHLYGPLLKLVSKASTQHSIFLSLGAI